MSFLREQPGLGPLLIWKKEHSKVLEIGWLGDRNICLNLRIAELNKMCCFILTPTTRIMIELSRNSNGRKMYAEEALSGSQYHMMSGVGSNLLDLNDSSNSQGNSDPMFRNSMKKKPIRNFKRKFGSKTRVHLNKDHCLFYLFDLVIKYLDDFVAHGTYGKKIPRVSSLNFSFQKYLKAATRAILGVGASIADLHNYNICQFESLLCTFVYLFFPATD
ncbi:hypothetical protein BpHYR1_028652 [Brachionus plicatilis]|uniref:Uncharacterized protein n=1 Tax=Brachionus plicatilis TaxID=10195 RepID=A0A3M7RWV2_BRAPC|nr:hypothetical protein BpHYR1_028652 [Brachionus plicatilis]